MAQIIKYAIVKNGNGIVTLCVSGKNKDLYEPALVIESVNLQDSTLLDVVVDLLSRATNFVIGSSDNSSPHNRMLEASSSIWFASRQNEIENSRSKEDSNNNAKDSINETCCAIEEK